MINLVTFPYWTLGRTTLRKAAASAALAAAIAAAAAIRAQDAPPAKPSVLVTSSAQRRAYLASATVWQEKALPSPEAIVEGPPGNPGGSRAQVNPPDGIPCTYESGSAGMGGKTPKFTCRTPDGRSIRVKYFSGDPATGNREVFAEVVATRLFWALGFPADRVYPITVNCKDCPADPMHGTGARAARKYLGVTEPHFAGELILSRSNPEQGWQFGEMDAAIAALPDGPDKLKRRMEFDALSLLAVFLQHGDRKPPNQRLVCLGGLDERAGDVNALGDNDAAGAVPALFERSGATACQVPAALIQDLGSTFGGSGVRASKIQLSSWAKRPVFLPPPPRTIPRGGATVCRGNLVASFDAGDQTGTEPRISEAGRAMLAGLLASLSDAHIRALFEAGRVDQLPERMEWRDPDTKQIYTGIDAWVAAFKHKRKEITDMRCGG
jgi:hypothetical protein